MTAAAAALALIPARGGSKGIPGKNLQEVEGVSLVGRSVQAALASTRVSRVVVSTDDDAIAAAARSHGAEVVRRPEHLPGTPPAPSRPCCMPLSSSPWMGHCLRSWCFCSAPLRSPVVSRSIRCWQRWMHLR